MPPEGGPSAMHQFSSCFRSVRATLGKAARCALLCTSILLCSSPSLPPGSTPENAASVVTAARAEIAEKVRSAPLVFERSPDCPSQFVAHGSGFGVLLTPSAAVLKLQAPELGRRQAPHEKQEAQEAAVSLSIGFVDANPAPVLEGAQELAATTHYFLGKREARWRRNVRSFGRVVYREIYPGIDLAFYGTRRQFDYDFIIAAGADPRRITLDFRGVDRVRLDAAGKLVLDVQGRSVEFTEPSIYQEHDGARRSVAGTYALRGGGRVGFELGDYDRNRELVIDPTLVFATIVGGGEDDDYGKALAVDSSGSVYVAGETQSLDFATVEDYSSDSGFDLNDAFVVKLGPLGNVLYSVYFGGDDSDTASDIAVDAQGNVYVTGFTDSSDFPVKNPLQSTGAADGTSDAFVLKLNPTGSELIFSTYLGGSSTDYGNAIALDSQSSVYVVGATESDDFPLAAPRQSTLGGSDEYSDAFVTQLDANGRRLIYSTYLGGSEEDEAYAVAVNDRQEAWIAGQTHSHDFPTRDAPQPSYGDDGDAFVVRLGGGGRDLLNSTFLGGSSTESGDAIALDREGNVYVTGSTYSSDFPTLNPVQGALDGTGRHSDAFVAGLDATGTRLLFATYLGGDDADFGAGIAVDQQGFIYVSGDTYSSDFPGVKAEPGTHDTGSGFISIFGPKGSALKFSMYFGGSDRDTLSRLALGPDGDVYVAGTTRSVDFQQGIDVGPGGAVNGFAARLRIQASDYALPPAPRASSSAASKPPPPAAKRTVATSSQSSTPVVRVRVYDATGAATPKASLLPTLLDAGNVDGVYALNIEYVPIPSEIEAPEDGVVLLSDPVPSPLILHFFPRVGGFGRVKVYADNGGQGYTRPAEGSWEIDLPLEAARSRITKTRALVAEHPEGTFRSETLARLAEAERLLDEATEGSSVDPKLVFEALSAGLWAGEMATVDAAKRAISERGKRTGFHFGCSTAGSERWGAREKRMFSEVFNFSTVAEFFLVDYERKPGKLTSDLAQQKVSWLRRKGIPSKGHPLVYLIDQATPDWLKGKPFEFVANAMRTRIERDVRLFRRRVGVWDIINEANQPNRYFSRDQIHLLTRLAAEWTKQADPEAVRVVNVDWPSGDYVVVPDLKKVFGRAETPLEYLRTLIQAGVDYDAIGIQMYYPGLDLMELSRLLDRYGRLGKPIHITEIGVSSAPASDPQSFFAAQDFSRTRGEWHRPWDEELQAEWIEQFYTIAYSKPAVQAMIYWDFVDAFWPWGGLMTRAYEPKRSFYRLRDLLKSWGFASAR